MSKRQAELRWEMKRVLANLDARWVKAALGELVPYVSQVIETLAERPVNRILAWSSYVPGAPDLSPLLSKELGRREVYLSRTGGEGGLLFLRIGKDLSELDAAGAHDPGQGWGAPYDGMDGLQTVALIPGLLFDQFGARLGRGVGEYDRFFSRPEMRAVLKIGVCWSFQVREEVPSDSDNVVVDFVVHERGVINVQENLRTASRP